MDSKNLESLYKLILSNPFTFIPPIILTIGIFFILIASTTTFQIPGLNVKLTDSRLIRWMYALAGIVLSVVALLSMLGVVKPSNFINSDDPSVLFQTGQLLEELNDNNNALQAYSKAVTLNPKEPHNVWYRKGIVEFNLGRYEEAANSFKEALTAKPDFTKAALLLGNSLFKTENYDQALAAYDKVIKLDGKIGDPWYNKALIYESKQQLEQAIKAYKKAYTLNPRDTNSYAALKRLNVSVAPPSLQAKNPGESLQGIPITPTNEASNFRVMCGDPLPNDPNLFPIKLYPVYINYDEATLRKIKLEMCGDASPTPDQKFRLPLSLVLEMQNASRTR